MRLIRYLWLLLLASNVASAASSWTFTDGTITLQTKGAGVGGGRKEKLLANTAFEEPFTLGSADTLKIILTIQEGKKAAQPHQAFLTLSDPLGRLSDSFPFTVKESGKARVELTQKDLPVQLLASGTLRATLTFASFGTSTPYNAPAFMILTSLDDATPLNLPPPPVRYAPKSEIHHKFREDPRSPPRIITLVFTAAVIAALPALFIVWASLGANLNHLQRAMKTAPLSHTVFFGSVCALEGIFFMYYTSWNLFKMLPAAAGVGLVAFVSGSRALSEVQERRLAGVR